jgi:hypothetical protein
MACQSTRQSCLYASGRTERRRPAFLAACNGEAEFCLSLYIVVRLAKAAEILEVITARHCAVSSLTSASVNSDAKL